MENNIEHLAMEITKLATVSILHKKAAKVYAVLTSKYQSTGEIARKVDMCSKDVSSFLNTIKINSTLLKVRRDGKLKYWAKR